MSEYLKPEHAFLNKSPERLQERLEELNANRRNIGYTGLRLSQVMWEIDNISFELAEQQREARGESISEAWAESAIIR